MHRFWAQGTSFYAALRTLAWASGHQGNVGPATGRGGLAASSWILGKWVKRAGPGEVLWAEGSSAFAFLVRDWGFLGPERIDDGLAYHRPSLHVRIEFWAWNHEAGFSTTVERVDDLSARVQAASLDRLYVVCGLGPAQDVPETAGSGHALRKRISQHSTALQLVIPHLRGPAAASLFARCSGREPAGS
jgi:hypothetical protein